MLHTNCYFLFWCSSSVGVVVRRGVVVSIDKNVNQARSGVWEPTSIDKVNQPRRPDQVADQGAGVGPSDACCISTSRMTDL